MSFGRYLAAAFILNGVGSIGMKMLSQLKVKGVTPVALAVLYGVAAVAATIVLMSGPWKFQGKSLVMGLAAGLFSCLGLSTSMLALSLLPAYIVFPVSSGGTILMVAIIGRFAHGEKLGPCGIVGLVAGLAAIVLLAS
jgi:multidrug transporter EmrE-like cation transporter